jgi:hypothetical protein
MRVDTEDLAKGLFDVARIGVGQGRLNLCHGV